MKKPTQQKRKARKMKAEILWALVYFDGKVRGITQPELFTTRAIATPRRLAGHGGNDEQGRPARRIRIGREDQEGRQPMKKPAPNGEYHVQNR
jgi:hypothetical protein